MKNALLRHLPDSYKIYDRPARPMSLDLAKGQHADYARALEEAGLKIGYVEKDESKYDCVFIEDTVVAWHGSALITRMQGDRVGEHGPVRQTLSKTHQITELKNPESLIEGGDVLHTDNVTYVGRSARTNDAGIKELREFLKKFDRTVVEVLVSRCLHLKTGATFLGNNTLLIAPNLIDPSAFSVSRIISTSEGEEGVANSMRIGNHLLISSGFPRTESKLREFARENSIAVNVVEASEFAKGDGSLTCLSVLW